MEAVKEVEESWKEWECEWLLGLYVWRDKEGRELRWLWFEKEVYDDLHMAGSGWEAMMILWGVLKGSYWQDNLWAPHF